MNYKIIDNLKTIQKVLEDKFNQRWMTLIDICKHTSLSPSTIRRAIQRGELKASKQTGKLLFKISDVERWLNG